MKTIRRNTFETNSSSVHCVTILSDKEFNLIKEGKAVLEGNCVEEITSELVNNYINDKIDTSLIDMKYLFNSIPAHDEKDLNAVNIKCLPVGTANITS